MDTKLATRQAVNSLIDRNDALFKRYGDDDMPADVRAEVAANNESLEALLASDSGLKDNYQSLRRFAKEPVSPMVHPGGGGARGRGSEGKSLGDLFVASDTFKHHDAMRKVAPSSEIELKTLLTETGWAPQSVRLPRLEPGVVQPLTLLDFVATGATTQTSITYMEETTTTNAAAEVAEGDEKQESAIAFTQRTEPVQTVATVLPVTNQLLEDVAASRDYINQRLMLFVRRRLETQIVLGNGTPPNISGFLDRSIQTQAKGGDPTPDAIQKAITLIEINSEYEPDAIVMHPSDWQQVRLLRTSDDNYFFGAVTQLGQKEIMGLPVLTTTAITEGTALVGAFKTACMLFYRTAMQIAISDSHSDFFIKNKQMLRAEVRAALAVFAPYAFASVTGI